MNTRITGNFGLIGSATFLITVLLLGLLQPGYNHMRDTVSMLSLGQFGFLQTINFFLLGLTFAVVGISMGWSMHKRVVNAVSITFIVFALALALAAIFPTHPMAAVAAVEPPTLTAKIHFWGSLALVLYAPIMVFTILHGMYRNHTWKKFIPYTVFVLMFNFIFGCLWFYLLRENSFFAWKGICQKVLITNVVVWLMVMSEQLRKMK